MRAERRALAEGDEAAAGADATDELGDQPRLAEARVGADADGVAAALDCAVERRGQGGELGAAPEDVELVAPAAPRDVAAAPGERVDGDGLGLALQLERRQRLPGERVARQPFRKAADVDAARRRLRHQPRCEVDRVAEADERPPLRVAVGAAAEAAGGDADLQVRGGGDLVESSELERGGHGARAVVLVRVRRAEDGVEVGALVADRDLEHVAAVLRADPLRVPDEVVELPDRTVGVVVDAPELDEHRDRRAQLGEELSPSGAEPLVDGRQDPLADDLLRQPLLRGDRQLRRRIVQPGDDADRPSPVGVAPALADLHPVAERGERRLVQHDLSLLRMVLGGGEVVDQAPGEHVDQLDLRVADDEAARVADGDGDLHREADAGRAGRNLLADHLHRLLHRERAGGRARAVVAVEPARDRVAAEVDDVAAEAIELGDDGVKDEVEAGGQLFGAALRPELGGKCLRQRREPGDVGEDRRAVHTVRQLDAGRERPPPVTGDVRLGVVEGELCPRHRLGRSPDVGHRLLGQRVAASSRQCLTLVECGQHESPPTEPLGGPRCRTHEW